MPQRPPLREGRDEQPYEEQPVYEVPEPRMETARIWSPRLVDREQVKDFVMEVEDLEDEADEVLWR